MKPVLLLTLGRVFLFYVADLPIIAGDSKILLNVATALPLGPGDRREYMGKENSHEAT